MTKDELFEENEGLRATLRAIFDQIAVVLDIEVADDLDVFEDEETSA